MLIVLVGGGMGKTEVKEMDFGDVTENCNM